MLLVSLPTAVCHLMSMCAVLSCVCLLASIDWPLSLFLTIASVRDLSLGELCVCVFVCLLIECAIGKYRFNSRLPLSGLLANQCHHRSLSNCRVSALLSSLIRIDYSLSTADWERESSSHLTGSLSLFAFGVFFFLLRKAAAMQECVFTAISFSFVTAEISSPFFFSLTCL